MMDIHQAREDLLKEIRSLPEDSQRALGCLIVHYDTIHSICKAKTLTEEERRHLMDIARLKNDPLVHLLVLFERRVNSPDSP